MTSQNPTSKLGRFLRPLSKPFILQMRRLRLARGWDLPKVTRREPGRAAILIYNARRKFHGCVHLLYWVCEDRKSHLSLLYSKVQGAHGDTRQETHGPSSRSFHWGAKERPGLGFIFVTLACHSVSLNFHLLVCKMNLISPTYLTKVLWRTKQDILSAVLSCSVMFYSLQPHGL